MFTINTYFEGKVTSIAVDTPEGPATIGAMKAGDYQFGTSTIEHMTVITGSMQVQQAGEQEWKTYQAFETFIVAKDARFKVKTDADATYLCLYK